MDKRKVAEELVKIARTLTRGEKAQEQRLEMALKASNEISKQVKKMTIAFQNLNRLHNAAGLTGVDASLIDRGLYLFWDGVLKKRKEIEQGLKELK